MNRQQVQDELSDAFKPAKVRANSIGKIMTQRSSAPFAQVELLALSIPVNGSRGVWGFAVVKVPVWAGFTVEAALVDGLNQCWPQMESGAWWVFETPKDAEDWLDEEREAGLDWSRWAARG